MKKANGEIRKKLLDPSEPVVLGTLHLLDSLVKNTPGALNKDIVSQDILSAMKAIVTGVRCSCTCIEIACFLLEAQTRTHVLVVHSKVRACPRLSIRCWKWLVNGRLPLEMIRPTSKSTACFLN